MHVGKDHDDSAGLLSFLGGNRKIGAADEKKKESVFSNMGSAIRFSLLISLLLWWLPIIGQIAAGLVGGRKAGTAARGMVATLVSAVVLIAITTVIGAGLVGGFDFINTDASSAAESMGEDSSILGGLLTGIIGVMRSLFSGLTGTTSMNIPIYIIMVVFGLIGGAWAEQHVKEIEKAAPQDTGRVFMPRSLRAYVQGKKIGFGNFDDRLAIQQSKAADQDKIVTVHRTLIRKAPARDEPAAIAAGDVQTQAVQDAEDRESPFAGLIHRAEKNDPEKERVRHSSSADEMEYI